MGGPAYTLVDTLQFKGLSNITGHVFPLMILVLHAREEEMGRGRGMISQKNHPPPAKRDLPLTIILDCPLNFNSESRLSSCSHPLLRRRVESKYYCIMTLGQ